MATIFNMYQDIATPDVTADIRESRRESEANTRKTQETAFGMLKRSNIRTLQQQYREGKGRFAGITDPDKKFQIYYDALKALDPQAAQDAAKVYGEERQRSINREIAAAYKSQSESGNPDIDNLRKKIEALKSEISATEASEAASEKMKGYQPSNMPEDVPNSLADYYTNDRKIPAFDISLSREVTQETGQLTDPRNQPRIGNGMEDYIPASRYEGYVPMTRNIATMYRGR